MELLPSDVREILPPLYAREGNKDPTVYAKLFFPASRHTWFVAEGAPEGDDLIFLGHVICLAEEWVYYLGIPN